MKSFTRISSVLIVAAVAAAFTSSSVADDVAIKPLRYQPPVNSSFTPKVTVAPKVTCAACTDSYKPVVTQDTKLKTKTVVVAIHGCKDCKTSMVRTGAQKATGKDVALHTCGTLMAAAENCCAGMK